MRLFSSWSLRHPLSLLGASIASVSGILILLVLAAGLTGFESNPYLGLLALLVLPALLVVGLLLIPIGTWLSARRASRPYPVLDINRPSHRTAVVIFLALTAVNLALLSAAAFKTIHYVDSPQFCGQVCHKVMHPEYTAWQDSPHAEVPCVACHVGPGAGGFVRAKINGLNQLAGIITGNYEHPIPAPVQNLRPARETCEQCHWPQLMHGDRLKVKTAFVDDEASTQQSTVLTLKVGGAAVGGGGSGIHWHMNIANKVLYVPSDETRQVIPYVRLTDREGKVTEYLASGASRPSEAEIQERGREMDCIDCHNRAAHDFAQAHVAVDDAIAAGRLPRDLPFLRKNVLVAVSETYDSAEAADSGIREKIRSLYTSEHAEVAQARADDIARAGAEAAAIYRRNVYPAMSIAWGTYPSMAGHTDTNGCFRCHSGEHTSTDGKTITNDCGFCHTLLAVEEPDPEILRQLNP